MKASPIDISVVVPVYGCDGALIPLYERVKDTIESIPATFELILVDDCGPGQPWEIITDLSKKDSRVVGVRLSRNFGQHSAIMAGLCESRGAWVVVMDCDLQDPPEEIPKLWSKTREGHDAVIGCRFDRRDSFLKKFKSALYHRFFDYMTEQKSDETQANFAIYSRKVVDIVKQLEEQPRALLLLVRWAGFDVVPIEVRHESRIEGKSSYTLTKQVKLAADTIVSYSTKPLRICAYFGFLISISSFLYGIVLILRQLLFHQAVEGWTSVMVSVYFLSGIILLALGIQGIYIGRVFGLAKKRPLYIVSDRTSADVPVK